VIDCHGSRDFVIEYPDRHMVACVFFENADIAGLAGELERPFNEWESNEKLGNGNS
jgi:hypothetical protein